MMMFMTNTNSNSSIALATFFDNSENEGTLLQGLGDAAYSSKTENWIINKGNATFSDVQKLLDLAPEGSVIEWSIWT